MVVVVLEESVMLPPRSLLLTPTAVAYHPCIADADTLLLRAAMVVVALKERVTLPL